MEHQAGISLSSLNLDWRNCLGQLADLVIYFQEIESCQMLVILVQNYLAKSQDCTGCKGRFESQMRQICVRLGWRKLSVLNQVIG